MFRSSTSWVALIGVTVLVLTGCSVSPPTAPEPDDPEPATGAEGQPTECIVGTWELIVPDYALQADEYLTGLGIPLENFTMDGAQVLTLTEDGLLAVDTDLTSTGDLVAGSTILPFSITTVETATAEWGWDAGDLAGDGVIQIAEYLVVESATETPAEAAAAGVEPPVPTLGEGAQLTVDCDANNLLLSGGGPLSAAFARR